MLLTVLVTALAFIFEMRLKKFYFLERFCLYYCEIMFLESSFFKLKVFSYRKKYNT